MSRREQKAEGKRSVLQITREEAEQRIQAQVDLGINLLSVQITNMNQLDEARAELKKWSDYNAELLRRIVDTYELVRDYYPRVAIASWTPLPFPDQVKEHFSDIKDYINRLESIRGRLELIPESSNLSQARPTATKERIGDSDKVFVVHGHDEEAKQSVARCIEKLGLVAIILHEQPNQGRTIIEKFEEYADVGFAVVLLTPDDIGASMKSADSLLPRARQNVILELGFFIGKLGRGRVCALYKGDVEIPSDFSGVLWTKMDSDEAWRFGLAKEMKASGLSVDLNKLM